MDTDSRPAAGARSRDTRSRFDRFVGLAQQVVSRPEAFTVVVAVILLWGISYPAFHEVAEWHAVIHSVSSIISLMLLVLLENAGRRADQAAQEKLNVMSEALVALLDERADAHADTEGRDPLNERAQALRTAIGLEARH